MLQKLVELDKVLEDVPTTKERLALLEALKAYYNQKLVTDATMMSFKHTLENMQGEGK